MRHNHLFCALVNSHPKFGSASNVLSFLPSVLGNLSENFFIVKFFTSSGTLSSFPNSHFRHLHQWAHLHKGPLAVPLEPLQHSHGWIFLLWLFTFVSNFTSSVTCFFVTLSSLLANFLFWLYFYRLSHRFTTGGQGDNNTVCFAVYKRTEWQIWTDLSPTDFERCEVIGHL